MSSFSHRVSSDQHHCHAMLINLCAVDPVVWIKSHWPSLHVFTTNLKMIQMSLMAMMSWHDTPQRGSHVDHDSYDGDYHDNDDKTNQKNNIGTHHTEQAAMVESDSANCEWVGGGERLVATGEQKMMMTMMMMLMMMTRWSWCWRNLLQAPHSANSSAWHSGINKQVNLYNDQHNNDNITINTNNTIIRTLKSASQRTLPWSVKSSPVRIDPHSSHTWPIAWERFQLILYNAWK